MENNVRKPAVKSIVVTALFAASLYAQAGPISLAPIGNAQSADIVQTLNVYGSCGGAVVKVIGIAKDSFGPDKSTFSFDNQGAAGIFILPGDGKSPGMLRGSDYNTVLCVPVGQEFRVVFGSVCSGSACGDAMNYVVFDPKLGKNVSPTMCDISCASKFIKSNVLKKIGLM
jgi:hypothetical protein